MTQRESSRKKPRTAACSLDCTKACCDCSWLNLLDSDCSKIEYNEKNSGEMKALFRVDSSLEIGSGHVIRCMTLARELAAKGFQVMFICADLEGSLVNMIRMEFDVEVIDLESATIDLKSNTRPLEKHQLNDAEATLEKLRLQGVAELSLLVVDHYKLDRYWEEYVKARIKVIVSLAIDDLADRYHTVDLLLDQNKFGPDSQRAYHELVPRDCKLLLGPRYALLHPAYKLLHQVSPQRTVVKRILVYAGGVDPFGIVERSAQVLSQEQFEDIEVDIVIGSQVLPSQGLSRLLDSSKNITSHRNLASLAGLLARADLCIGAGGTTTWERACLRVPTLIVALAKNQEGLTKVLVEDGHAMTLGDRYGITNKVIEESVLVAIKDIRKLGTGYELCDGYGAERVLDNIEQFLREAHQR